MFAKKNLYIRKSIIDDGTSEKRMIEIRDMIRQKSHISSFMRWCKLVVKYVSCHVICWRTFFLGKWWILNLNLAIRSSSISNRILLDISQKEKIYVCHENLWKIFWSGNDGALVINSIMKDRFPEFFSQIQYNGKYCLVFYWSHGFFYFLSFAFIRKQNKLNLNGVKFLSLWDTNDSLDFFLNIFGMPSLICNLYF